MMIFPKAELRWAASLLLAQLLLLGSSAATDLAKNDNVDDDGYYYVLAPNEQLSIKTPSRLQIFCWKSLTPTPFNLWSKFQVRNLPA